MIEKIHIGSSYEKRPLYVLKVCHGGVIDLSTPGDVLILQRYLL